MARICGICPVAYQMSAVHAFEDAAGIEVDPAVRALRRLLYCGEWIESHALHVYFLHAPDFLGYASAIELARDHRVLVERALELKKAGNRLVSLVGGRPIHPVTVRVGGFYHVPVAVRADGPPPGARRGPRRSPQETVARRRRVSSRRPSSASRGSCPSATRPNTR